MTTTDAKDAGGFWPRSDKPSEGARIGANVRPGFEIRLVTPRKLYVVGHGKVRPLVWDADTSTTEIGSRITRICDEIIIGLIDDYATAC